MKVGCKLCVMVSLLSSSLYQKSVIARSICQTWSHLKLLEGRNGFDGCVHSPNARVRQAGPSPPSVSEADWSILVTWNPLFLGCRGACPILSVMKVCVEKKKWREIFSVLRSCFGNYPVWCCTFIDFSMTCLQKIACVGSYRWLIPSICGLHVFPSFWMFIIFLSRVIILLLPTHTFLKLQVV